MLMPRSLAVQKLSPESLSTTRLKRVFSVPCVAALAIVRPSKKSRRRKTSLLAAAAY
jgi:hypothetical protein